MDPHQERFQPGILPRHTGAAGGRCLHHAAADRGPTRAQDERVKEFAARHTKKLTCFDTKEYALPGISDEFRPLLSPVVMAAVLQRISKNIEVITDHSLDIRRYYRKESY